MGEVWIYLTYEAEYLKISHPDFSSTEFWLPFDMEGGHGYEMTLVNKIQQVNTGYGTLKITTQPDGASISLNGKAMSQKTPYYNEMTAVGKYEIMISKDRYQTVLKTVKIVDNTEKSISERLIYDFANITVSSDSGVEIFVDGKSVGKSFWKGELRSGSHTVKCAIAYHSDAECTIDVVAEKEARCEIHPTPILGVIEITSEPTGANIFIDGKNCGTTPLTLTNIIIGPHELKLAKNGCAPITKNITLDEENLLAINEKLLTGRAVSISTDRAGDKLYADGSYIGVSPMTATLAFGEHTIKAVRDLNNNKNPKTIQKTISVAQGSGSVEVRLTFKQEINGHEYVDLGLPSGTLWATCNVGASKPEDYGFYFALGETTTKSIYSWSTYKWCRDSYDSKTKYNTRSDYGTVDNRKVLELSDDAARANWGGSWRMPTYDELMELKGKCKWQWTSRGGKNGYRVTGPNGKSIFLPAAGFYFDGSLSNAGSLGYYWSSSLYTDSPHHVYYLYFGSRDVYMNYLYRYYGRLVRPVCPPQN